MEESKRATFISQLDDLFDIAHENALDMMKNEEDKQFLVMQRMKRRQSSMTGIDHKFKVTEERKQERRKREAERRKRTHEEIERKVMVPSATLSGSDTDNADSNSYDYTSQTQSCLSDPNVGE